MRTIPAGNPSDWTGPGGNNTFLLTGAVPTLIDAGIGKQAHLDAVAEALEGAPLALLLITHGHKDHTLGVGPIRQRWPAVVVRNFPPDVCRDNEIICAGDTTLRALHTPGHSPDHFCFLDEATGDLYCGDLARLGGTVVVPASTGGDLIQYLDSLRRIRTLAPRRLLPGHGPAATDPIALIDAYIAHRLDRERQVLEALRSGCITIDAIVERVYAGLPRSLAPAAAESVHAHLLKLAAERAVVETPDGWRIA